jgi:acyl-CoA reductase-like NAD-dependent aldehyde dehydrogenase
MVTVVQTAIRKITSVNPANRRSVRRVCAGYRRASPGRGRAGSESTTEGARVLVGGLRLKKLGSNFYALTVLANVSHQMRVMCEETFGPVLPIMLFDTEDDAVHLANDSEYGLGASIRTRNRRRGEQLAGRISAGTVMVNDALSCYGVGEAPHGGMRMSGVGRTHGGLGLGRNGSHQVRRLGSDAGK